MDCKECQQQIPQYLKDQLEYSALKRFCKHIKSCKECEEELTIQFLITEGMSRLEEGDVFELNKELDRHLSEAKRKIRRNDKVLQFGTWVEAIVMAGVFALLFWQIFRS